MKLTPIKFKKTPEKAAEYIKTTFHSDLEKARAIYYLVATEIEYDFKKLLTKDIYYESESKEVKKAWQKKAGICGDYSMIYKQIAKSCGLETEMVIGYTKMDAGVRRKTPSHGWNAVKVDGKWILLDVTWGSGGILKGKYKTESDYSEHYFNVPPKMMILSHFPVDRKWQLTDTIVSAEQYNNAPMVHNRAAGFVEIFYPNSKLYRNDSVDFKIKFQYYRSYKICVLNSNGTVIDEIPMIQSNEKNNIFTSRVFIPENAYKVSVYIDKELGWHSVLEYLVANKLETKR